MTVFCPSKMSICGFVCVCVWEKARIPELTMLKTEFDMKWSEFHSHLRHFNSKWFCQNCPNLSHLRCKFDVTKFAISRLLFKLNLQFQLKWIITFQETSHKVDYEWMQSSSSEKKTCTNLVEQSTSISTTTTISVESIEFSHV